MSLSANKVTDNTHEMSFHELMSQSAQLRIPLFQRPYVWSDKQFSRMSQELDSIVEGEDANRFLGAIIAVRRLANPAEPQPFEIVDGQQRLTTLYLFILAAAQVAARHKDNDYAIGLINTNLIVPWSRNAPNTKIVPSYNDRSQFREIYRQLFETKGLTDWLPQQARLPEATGTPQGKLESQFQRIRRYLEKKFRESGIDGLKSVVEAARTRLTFVFILLKDPATATTVFEGLNDPGVPIGVGDLVRNEVFSKIGDEPDQAIAIHATYWVPFQQKLKDLFDDYFFPYCIIHEPGALRADMFRELREKWGETTDAIEIIQQLDAYTSPFMAVAAGEIPSSYSKDVREGVSRLVRMRRPAAVYPFIMRLLHHYENGEADSTTTRSVLDVIESFLVRRALAGLEPTGLLGLFRFLWNNVEGKPTADSVSNVILRRLTVEWPDDARLKEQIIARPLYGSSIAQYILLEHERSLGADFPDGVTPWIEHIAPQKLNQDWRTIYSTEDHKELVDTWANLIPLSSQMNTELSQRLYSEKQEAYRRSSVFASARRLAEEYSEWAPKDILCRAHQLADWAITRWPRPHSGRDFS